MLFRVSTRLDGNLDAISCFAHWEGEFAICGGNPDDAAKLVVTND